MILTTGITTRINKKGIIKVSSPYEFDMPLVSKTNDTLYKESINNNLKSIFNEGDI